MSFVNTDRTDVGEYEDEEVKAAFESYKSKVYALTVPLRIVALRNSVPPLWIKVSLPKFSCLFPVFLVSCAISHGIIIMHSLLNNNILV